ncbi:MAG TPA: O-antigen ligase family protein [Candidatus Binataceae bacterium]|nr:O-antigen ligase family protein [Candidatus Binataceae bacterium]
MSAGGSLRWFDRVITAGIGLLIVSTPLAIGSVHWWAYTTLEAVIFALAVVWMIRVWVEGSTPARMSIAPKALRRLFLPMGLIIAWVALQIVPLPPAVIGVISPGAYRVYQIGMPGWPVESPYRALIAAWQASLSKPTQPQIQVVLPPVEQSQTARAQAAAPEAVAKKMPPKTFKDTQPAVPGLLGRMRWRTLAIAPLATWSGLIEIVACMTLFSLVLLYPFGLAGAGMDAQKRFLRTLIILILGSGLLVAMLGIAEHGWWNGKILWFFIPNDWTGPLLNNPRASGPFVNPDHFANYLAMILPLAVAGALFPILPGFRHKRSSDIQLICAVVAFVIASAIMMSLSRGGWMVAIVGVATAIGLSARHARDQLPAMLRGFEGKLLPALIGGIALILLGLMYLAGPTGRSQASLRVASTLSNSENLTAAKPWLWSDTAKMIRDFPLVGVGVGGWPEIFPRYQRPPWINLFFFRQPENDYLQLLAETGIVGLMLAAWFVWTLFGRLREGAARLSSRDWPLFAGLAGGIVASLMHEIFDFSLQTPANLVLFTVLLAAALRLAMTKGVERPSHVLRSVSSPSNLTFAKAATMGLAASGLIVIALTQPEVGYPFDVKKPKSFADAEATMVVHPARANSHLAMAALMPAAAPQKLVTEQLKAAVWFDPNDPFGRDLYARSLFLTGDKHEGLGQIKLSVEHSPALDTHFYLAPAMIPWLLPDEQRAVTEGLNSAVSAGYADAAEELARFYATLGRNRDAAVAEAGAAAHTRDLQEKTNYLVDAGQYYAKAGDLKGAKQVLTEAALIDPNDPRPIGELIIAVLGPEKDLNTARALVQAGVERGGDPAELYLALADAAHEAHDPVATDDALLQVLSHEPSFSVTMAAGSIYADEGNYDRAAVAYQHATEMDPHSAEALFRLAKAEEGAYEYALASHDYASALAIDPGSNQIRTSYVEFQRRAAQSAADAARLPPTAPAPSPGG